MVKKEKAKKRKADYDSAWKDVIERFFEPMLTLFFPSIHHEIDFTKKPEFLTKESRRFHPGSKTGGRRADAVIKVRLKDGSQ